MSIPRGFQTTFSVGATPIQIAPNNPHRRSLIISAANAFGVLLALGGPNSGQAGLYLNKGIVPLQLSFDEHGRTVQMDVWAVQYSGDTPSGNTQVTVWQSED